MARWAQQAGSAYTAKPHSNRDLKGPELLSRACQYPAGQTRGVTRTRLTQAHGLPSLILSYSSYAGTQAAAQAGLSSFKFNFNLKLFKFTGRLG